MNELDEAVSAVRALGSGTALTQTIADIERSLQSTTRDAACSLVDGLGITGATLDAALLIKDLSSQIDVVVHMVGILVSLPYVLGEGEIVESLSLGAGNTGRLHDLETDRQMAEFKFIQWRGGPESIRQNGAFIDFFNLASADTTKRRVLYVVGKATPLRFFQNSRAISSVLSRNAAAADRFRALHGDTFTTVRDYFETVRDVVEIVDLRDVVPAFAVDSVERLQS